MSDAALATLYETYRMACGLREDGVRRPATMGFWQTWVEYRRRLERSGDETELAAFSLDRPRRWPTEPKMRRRKAAKESE